MGGVVVVLFSLCTFAAEAPTYEKEISDKVKVSSESSKLDQKSFYDVIGDKSKEVAKYIQATKDDLRKQQEVTRKEFEAKLKSEIAELKAQDPRANLEAVRHTANEKRRDFFEKLNSEKKSLEDQMKAYKKTFDDFVKNQKENFQQQLKILSAKSKAAKMPPANTPFQQEFREIPPGPGTVLKPQ